MKIYIALHPILPHKLNTSYCIYNCQVLQNLTNELEQFYAEVLSISILIGFMAVAGKSCDARAIVDCGTVQSVHRNEKSSVQVGRYYAHAFTRGGCLYVLQSSCKLQCCMPFSSSANDQ